MSIGVLALLAGVLRFVWLPNHRPILRPGEEYGIDVSHHQGPIDWRRVAADGIGFAYIKATEGGDHRDSRFLENWQGSARAGIERGAYHFFTLCRPGDEQAANFLRAVANDTTMLPPAADLEFGGNCSARPDPVDLRAELATFIQEVEAATGQRMILYLHKAFDDHYAIREHFERPLWKPRFLFRPGGDDWLVWQVMSLAHIDGIRGGVDLDVGRF